MKKIKEFGMIEISFQMVYVLSVKIKWNSAWYLIKNTGKKLDCTVQIITEVFYLFPHQHGTKGKNLFYFPADNFPRI